LFPLSRRAAAAAAVNTLMPYHKQQQQQQHAACLFKLWLTCACASSDTGGLVE